MHVDERHLSASVGGWLNSYPVVFEILAWTQAICVPLMDQTHTHTHLFPEQLAASGSRPLPLSSSIWPRILRLWESNISFHHCYQSVSNTVISTFNWTLGSIDTRQQAAFDCINIKQIPSCWCELRGLTAAPDRAPPDVRRRQSGGQKTPSHSPKERYQTTQSKTHTITKHIPTCTGRHTHTHTPGWRWPLPQWAHWPPHPVHCNRLNGAECCRSRLSRWPTQEENQC